MFRQLAFLAAISLAFSPLIQAQEARTAPIAAIEITDAQLAAQVGENLLPIVPTKLFKPADTIFLSVSTNATADVVPGSLGVAWRYEFGDEQMAVHSEGKEIDFSGLGVTLFQVSKPDGWPEGNYSVEIFLNGKTDRKLQFKVL